LIEKEIFEEYYIQEDRVNFDENLVENDLKLNENQYIAFENIEKSFEKRIYVYFMV
jgi:primosomal protein N' (replication factor Y)